MSPARINGRCARVLDGQTAVKPGNAGIYGLCAWLVMAVIRLVAGLDGAGGGDAGTKPGERQRT